MGSGQSSAKAAEAQEADTSTQLFGSWDKPVAEAYAKKVSKKGKVVASKAAGAANAALGSAIDLEAGAGVKPSGRKTPGKQKGAGKTECPPTVIAHNCSCSASCPWLHYSLCGHVPDQQHVDAHCQQPFAKKVSHVSLLY